MPGRMFLVSQTRLPKLPLQSRRLPGVTIHLFTNPRRSTKPTPTRVLAKVTQKGNAFELGHLVVVVVFVVVVEVVVVLTCT